MCLQCKSTSPPFPFIQPHFFLPYQPPPIPLLTLTFPFFLSFLFSYNNFNFNFNFNMMGSQNKPTNIDGVDSKVVVVDTTTTTTTTTSPSSTTTFRAYHLLLRFLAFALTLIATFIVGVDKETKTITFYAGLRFQATAHWKYMSAFVYFLVANAIACSYGAASLVITELAARRGNNNGNNLRLRLAVTTSDLVIMALLFSACGAAAAIGMIGQHGNTHVHWMKVCDEFMGYCRHMTTAVVLSLVGSTAFLGLVALSLLSDSTLRTRH